VLRIGAVAPRRSVAGQGGAKHPHQQCLVTNKRKNDRSFIDESKVVYRNTLLPFLLSICLGVSYRTAYSFFYFQATCAPQKIGEHPVYCLCPRTSRTIVAPLITIRYDTIHTHTRLTALFRDYPGQPVSEMQNQSGFY